MTTNNDTLKELEGKAEIALQTCGIYDRYVADMLRGYITALKADREKAAWEAWHEARLNCDELFDRLHKFDDWWKWRERKER